ncbi:30S ribosomal protein S4 [Candidatus Gottesmanbacteria bacterium CG11_big_fil_rev_8_21_14_0_20_37_11]|uniref:Small ribosomal subunit protein uS4 n=3 Tax=Candidatus Gottesmaniibacteriota TaxID=1752720 RepID=A0A2M7RRW9_9BACT|nr:MAG: 30S ribosomal protein S4 [Candidatus Gottesmanbacteria bacterium CG1_02_37_22]PIP32636.1 MAG: 30S ribosomal protein S4 [Candidatus Gottesmanbacteria bacterium CG23_combo_of_CG06-09_8_20_14_all_37_19]PIR08512.1 MAG: 30S ribosomal protein S4 [Candidatus Gottesmanbacteria bacterium CG11_big_fil_rev_8_21_14_0_20_37_11]PIZ03068.1 MAG: 30S ribosomal protein S4 [Candidatus Gottesmanbacteria bacterium CG_4_10_14_0_8_um_filter_37_24]
MGRYTGPKNRLARREGVDLGLKTTGSSAHIQLLRRLKIKPGQHGQKGSRRKPSDYGIQLREKQKTKRMYGLLEKQFRKYFMIASREPRNTGEALLSLLERRLDNVIYRLNFAPTRAFARQMVTHGHVKIDGKKVNIPSFLVETDMIITIKQRMLENPTVKKLLEDKNTNILPWLEKKGPVGKISRLPKREDIQEDINEQLIIEFYSR